jgi:hypothetical protein
MARDLGASNPGTLALRALWATGLLAGCERSLSAERATVEGGAAAATSAAQVVSAEAMVDRETSGPISQTPDSGSDEGDVALMACEANANFSPAKAHYLVDCINRRFSHEAVASWQTPNTIVVRFPEPRYREVENFYALTGACLDDRDGGLHRLCKSISHTVLHPAHRADR